jgi:hypothetical protein
MIRPINQVARIPALSTSCAKPGVETCTLNSQLTRTYGNTSTGAGTQCPLSRTPKAR